MATSSPLLSFIVLSYNYEDYIGQTIASIQAQDVADFEIVVVDDGSRDRSRDVVRAIADSRIRLLVNERNLGGAGAYNRAVAAARGTWLVNLDADDWIKPGKARAQLQRAAEDPTLDVIGSFVEFVGPDGKPFPDSTAQEFLVNQPHDLNRVEAWIGRNPLCRSSTMVRRAAHLRVGLDDADMVRAPDYELWTRFLRHGCRFAVLPEPLTCYRLQPRGVTHGNPVETLLEMAWATLRNLVPVIERKALWSSFTAVLHWLAHHPELAALTVRERETLLTLALTGVDCPGYRQFRTLLAAAVPGLETLGTRALATVGGLAEMGQAPQRLRAENIRLTRDVAAFMEARDFWHGQSQRWEAEARKLSEALRLQQQLAAPQPIAAADPDAGGDPCPKEQECNRSPLARARSAVRKFWPSSPSS